MKPSSAHANRSCGSNDDLFFLPFPSPTVSEVIILNRKSLLEGKKDDITTWRVLWQGKWLSKEHFEFRESHFVLYLCCHQVPFLKRIILSF
ncbi:hypothetical protein TNIN_306051 [Trichonephila inaurata madagascariensis]|uniref:Uncharacterized protein n=1 Tax=Trichonephila inaurata madagascariensis TaxID=2747483 RepID=A0A8X6YM95_9ARAC|nr:hypothetical protein TNIN_306051 [Trichonephila inaurata madagascariensis]